MKSTFQTSLYLFITVVLYYGHYASIKQLAINYLIQFDVTCYKFITSNKKIDYYYNFKNYKFYRKIVIFLFNLML